eukprot:3499923-Amphidinium_carterae.1
MPPCLSTATSLSRAQTPHAHKALTCCANMFPALLRLVATYANTSPKIMTKDFLTNSDHHLMHEPDLPTCVVK